MSDKLSIKDVKANAKRFMQEKDYESALKNWMYINKNNEFLDPSIFYNMAKCYEHLDLIADAAKLYKQAITTMVENKELLESKLFLETLLALGKAQKYNKNYTSAIEAYTSFFDFEAKNTVEVPEETLEYVRSKIKECNEDIEALTKGKNVPNDYNSTNSK